MTATCQCSESLNTLMASSSKRGAHVVSIFDLTSRDFDVDAYISHQLKSRTLDEIIKQEEDMLTNVRRLDSDVHQIVYENYNKFLTATSTVRKIQNEFNNLESEMSSIGSSMKNIENTIEGLGDVLWKRNDNLLQLSSSYKAVKSVQFIFQLPEALQKCLSQKRYDDLIKVHEKARCSLAKFSDLANVADVLEKCDNVVKSAEDQLRKKVIEELTESPEEIFEAVCFLERLGVEREDLHDSMLASAEASLRSDLSSIEVEVEDVLDLVDKGCGTFLPNLTLFANLHSKLFPSKKAELTRCLAGLMSDFHEIVKKLFLSSSDPKDCSIVVRALDRYYRKMSASTQILDGLELSADCIDLINEVARHQIKISRIKIISQVDAALKELREAVLDEKVDLAACIARFEQVLVFNIKTSLANLLLFTASDVTFAALSPAVFQDRFAVSVHEDLLVGALSDVAEITSTYAELTDESRFITPNMLLAIAISLHHISSKSSHYLMKLCEEQFLLVERKLKSLTSTDIVASRLRSSVHGLIKRFVDQKGFAIGETVATAVENGAQLTTTPVGVRAVIRRAVNELKEFDCLLGVLLSDSRKETKTSRPPRALESYQRDTVWGERIDFHEALNCTRASIQSGVVRVFLKTFIEAIRMQTFGKHAVEQVQIDCYFLQRNLGPLVADEVVVNSLSDAALSSALKRSLDPVLLHPSKLTDLCEQQIKS